MLSKSDQIELLENFIARNKFSVSGWANRGLHPSGPEISEPLHIGFNETAGLLITALEENATKARMKRILISGIRYCKKLELDTEEKEYSADLFFELSSIVGVNIKHRLNLFLYGWFVIGLIYTVRLFKGEKKFKIIEQNCEKCNTSFFFHLESKTIKKNSDWIICQCLACDSYFLYNYDESAKYVKFENCAPVEYLSKDEFSYEQADIRLEQIKYFRK